MNKATVVTSGRATGFVVKGVVHVSKRSSSSFGLNVEGQRFQYCCQDGCCDRGLQSDVADVVAKAKALGAEKVVIRTGQRSFYQSRIADLPVEDVSDHVGKIDDEIFIDRRR